MCLAFSCKKATDFLPIDTNNVGARVTTTTTPAPVITSEVILNEGFENGTKTAYTSATVALGSGSWTMSDALIGTSTSDIKTGTKSVRITNTGFIAMNFNLASTATISFSHALYKGTTTTSVTWQLLTSSDNGLTYLPTGSIITTSSSTFQTATFTLNKVGNIRYKIQKLSGTNQLNIDNILIYSYSNYTPSLPDNDNLLLGNPSNAGTSVTANVSNYLLRKTQYVFSYNSVEGKPNWVSWHLNSSDLGSSGRVGTFSADPTLPSSWYQVTTNSYTGSGFDRGHNCPSGDRTTSVSNNDATFYMTNIMPQAPNNNQVTWAGLEDYTRNLVTGSGMEAYIIAGSYGKGGTGSNGGVTTTIDNGKVTVPSNCWKVIVLLSNANNDLSRINTSTRVIAVNMPNKNSITSDWKTFRTSVDAIESATGYDLLSTLSTSIQSVIEAKVDNQ